MSVNSGELPGLNLLSLDGGGVSGLSSLLIVREMMCRIRESSQLDRMPDPWEYFDMIAGTGTGAVSAVLLGRLRMSIGDAITAYTQLMSAVFSEPKSAFTSRNDAFKASVMEKKLKQIIQAATGNGEEKMVEAARDSPCKVVVYAMSAYHMTSCLPREFRTYVARTTALSDCAIWEALRATTTHPELFKEIRLGTQGEQERFVQGGLGCSNPTARLLDEAKEVFPDRKVASIISIGAGHARPIQVPEGRKRHRIFAFNKSVTTKVLRAAHGMATDNERVAEDMARRFAGAEFGYYRLNVGQGMQSIGAMEWYKMSEVSAHTQAYLAQIETKRMLNRIADAIRLREATLETIHIDGRVMPSPKTSPRVTHAGGFPLPSAHFTGREQLISKILAYFSSCVRKQNAFVLYGLGGAGKTQIALKCVELMRQRYTDIVFVDASSRESVEASLAGFAVARKVGQTHRDALTWLTASRNDCLMVFDNADNLEISLRDYFPRNPGQNIIITTRHQALVHLSRGVEASCNVSGMEVSEAEELLMNLAGMAVQGLEHEEKVVLHELLQELGCLALVLVQAGTFISVTGLSISQYFKLYTQQRRNTLEAGTVLALRLDGYQQTVYTTWELSFAQLSSLARQLLLLFAFIHRSEIREDILRRASIHVRAYTLLVPPSPAEVVARREVAGFLRHFEDEPGAWNSVLFLACISELVSLSLVTFDRANQSWTIHPLVQDWAREAVPDRASAFEKSCLLVAISIGLDDTTEGRSFRRAMISHVNTVISHTTNPDKTHLTISVNYAVRFAELYNEMGQTVKELHLRQLVMEASTRLLGDQHPDTLICAGNLAATFHRQGQLEEAEELFVTALAARKQVLGDSHPDTLVSMADLASIYQHQGQLVEAEELVVSVLAARKQILGDEHPDTLMSIAHLASIYQQQSQFVTAEELGRYVLATRKRVLGDEHPSTLISMAHLASIYHHQSRLRLAEELGSFALVAQTQVLGDEHPDTVMSMMNLAITYFEQDRFAETQILEERVLDIRKRVLGDGHPSTILAMRNLAGTYGTLEKWSDCDQLNAEATKLETTHLSF